MKRKTIITLATCLLLGIVLVVVLYAISDLPKDHRQNFTRLFNVDAVIETKALDIKHGSYYIAGASADYIYFGSLTDPLHLLRTNTILTDTQRIALSIENMDKLKFKSIRVAVNDPYFYIMDGNLPGIFRGKIGKWHADRFMYDSLYFNEAVPITPSSFAIRAIGINPRENLLGKISADTPYVKLNYKILEKQIDGLFCTYGLLHYNKALSQLIFVYYYRNQYLLLDTNLNILYKANTIDQTSRVQIKPADISSENSHTLASPSAPVNKTSCVSGKWLFNNSKILSRQEPEGTFDFASVIDVYDLKMRKYKLSFYLHHHEHQKLQNFGVFNNVLIAIYDHYIVSYDLNILYFKNSNTVGQQIKKLKDASKSDQI